MKKSTALLAVTAIASLSLASQAFAIGGSMGGGSARGSMSGGSEHENISGNPRMTSTMAKGNVSGMPQGAMQAAGGQQGAMASSGPNSMRQGTTRNGAGQQHGPKHGSNSISDVN